MTAVKSTDRRVPPPTHTGDMTVTTFEMDSDSPAPILAGSALVPFADRWTATWTDVDDSHTRLRVEHPEEDTQTLVGRVLGTAQGVRLVS
jgi:hypothetical protein